jgi:hypothetical protein
VVQFDLSDSEVSEVTEEEDASDEEEPEQPGQQGEEQQTTAQGAAPPPARPKRAAHPPQRLKYVKRGRTVELAGGAKEDLGDEGVEYCFGAAVAKPTTLSEALGGPDGDKWKESVEDEYKSLLENETWELTDLPPGKRAITTKWVFRHKYGPDGELVRHKTRLVAKGFQQKKGVDYDEVFAPVGKGTTLRVLLAAAANLGWSIEQMDVKTAFLNGEIEEELYMEQPEGMEDGTGRVCRLKKAIYGLKQAPRAWYRKLEETLLQGGFKKSENDHSLFLLAEGE